jgi:hypothetical protein
VDGALVRTMNASLALEEGCNLLFCLNPLVPFDATRSRARHSIAEHGLPTVLSQTFRSLIYSRMAVGRASYRQRFPQADQLLLEPDRDDERLFFTNVFRYSGRRRLAELNLKVLKDRHRSLHSAMTERRAQAHHTAANLGRVLRRLESLTVPPRRRG